MIGDVVNGLIYSVYAVSYMLCSVVIGLISTIWDCCAARRAGQPDPPSLIGRVTQNLQTMTKTHPLDFNELERSYPGPARGLELVWGKEEDLGREKTKVSSIEDKVLRDVQRNGILDLEHKHEIIQSGPSSQKEGAQAEESFRAYKENIKRMLEREGVKSRYKNTDLPYMIALYFSHQVSSNLMAAWAQAVLSEHYRRIQPDNEFAFRRAGQSFTANLLTLSLKLHPEANGEGRLDVTLRLKTPSPEQGRKLPPLSGELNDIDRTSDSDDFYDESKLYLDDFKVTLPFVWKDENWPQDEAGDNVMPQVSLDTEAYSKNPGYVRIRGIPDFIYHNCFR